MVFNRFERFTVLSSLRLCRRLCDYDPTCTKDSYCAPDLPCDGWGPYGIYYLETPPDHSLWDPFRHCRQPPGNPGGGFPDDTFSVSNQLFIDDQIDLENAYYRLAPKKGSLSVINSYALKNLIQERDLYLENLPEDSIPDANYINDIDIRISQLYSITFGDERSFWGDYSKTSDVANLWQGFSKSWPILLGRIQEPTIRRPIDSAPEDLKRQPILVIPSGGLFGLEKSEFLKASLDEYVKNGGTLVVFSQPHGYEFSVLPVPEEADGSYKTIEGYGWEEDQNCFTDAAYIDTWHQILAGQSRTTATLNIDGFFSNYPSNSTILLRRTANGQPALLMYEYGQGRVIVTSMYSDFALKQNQASSEEISLIRDMISWAKKPGQLPEIRPGESVSISVSVTNNTTNDASSLKFLIYNPDRATLLSEQSISASIAAGQTVTIPVTYAATQTSALGIYHIDYLLYDSSGKTIQPQAETDSGRFAVSNPPRIGTPDKPIWFSVTTSSWEVLFGDPFDYTFHVFNNTDQTRNLTISNYLRHTGRSHTWNVVATPNGEMTVSGSDPFLDSMYMYQTMDSRLYDESGQEIGKYELSFKGVYPSGTASVKTDKAYYGKGETVTINASVKNNVAFNWQPNVIIAVMDSRWRTVFEETKPITLAPSGIGTVSTSFTLPSNSMGGSYGVNVYLQWGTGWYSRGAYASFELTESKISVSPNLPFALIAGTNTIPFTVANLGKISVSSGTLDVSLRGPGGSIIYSGSEPFSVAVGETKTLAIPISIPIPKLGTYLLTYSQSDETRTGYPTNMTFSNSCSLDFSLDKPSYKIGETANLTASIVNTGKFLQEGSLTIEAPFLGLSETKPVTINPSATANIPFSFSLPLTLTQGGPIKLTLAFPSGDQVEIRPYLFVKPVKVEPKILLDKSSYRIRENLGINYVITNDGNFASPLNVSFNLSIPDLNYS
jgi:hypothetical protein